MTDMNNTIELPEPASKQFQDKTGIWCNFINKGHEEATVAAGDWPIRNLYTEQQVRELLAAQPKSDTADYLDGVNIARLRRALSLLGHASGVGDEEVAADLAGYVNALTRELLAGVSAPQPQADALDAARYRELIDYFISDRVDLDDALVAAKSTDEISKIIDAAIASKGDSA